MPKYFVTGIVDATVHAEVEANSPEEAADNAELYVGVCHQCANEIEIGDVVETRVSDAKGNEIYRDAPDRHADAAALVKYLKGKKRLPPEIAEILKHYA